MIDNGPGSVYYSALSAEPEMHPAVQLGMSLLPYGAMGFGVYGLSKANYGADTGLSLLDLTYATLRNFGIRTPQGVFNTFRASEVISPYTSGKFKGFNFVNQGIGGQNVFQYTVQEEFLKNSSSRAQIVALAEEEGNILKTKMLGDDWRLVFEQGGGKSTGSLFFQEITREVGADGKEVIKPIIGSEQLISKSILAIENTSAPDFYDLLSSEGRREQINPYTRAVYSNQNLGRDIEIDELYRNSEGKIAQFGFAPSPKGPVKNLDDFGRRLVVPGAYLTFGFSRINKLISSTLDQIPYAKDIFKEIGDITKTSIYTRPEPFHKQFMSLGLKLSSVGAAYMGLRTIDHYRREYGIPGHLIASSAIALGVGGITKAITNRRKEFMSTAPRNLALGAFALQMLPGFSEGTVEGIATQLVNADIARAYVGKYSGMSSIRRGIEGLFPGFTEPTTGALFGIGLAIASYSGLGKYLVRNDKKVLPELIRQRIGFTSAATEIPEGYGRHFSNILYERLKPVHDLKSFSYSGGVEFFETYNDFAEMRARPEYEALFKNVTKSSDVDEMGTLARRDLSYIFDKLEPLIADTYNISHKEAKIVGKKYFYGLSQYSQMQYYKKYQEANPINSSLIERTKIIKNRYANSGIIGKIGEKVELLGAQMYHAFFGASMSGDAFEKGIKAAGSRPVFARLGTLAVGGMILHQALTGSLFGTLETVDDLKAEYSGEKLVEVKRGRWWEGGGSPYEGKDTHYFRPNMYVSLMSKADEKAVWGDEYNKYNPISKFFLKNFTYHLEEKNYYDRPYPISSPAFEGLPIIGPLLGATIGSIIKPPKLMHEDEFMQVDQGGNLQYAYKKEYGSMEGEVPNGPPLTPNNLMSRYGEIQYQFREIEGITGYAKNVITKIFTGRETLGTMSPIMASSGQMDSSIDDYWNMELGGALFMSEAVRRFFPRKRAEIDYYNPIMNSMPSYVPDRLKLGDPFTAIQNGYLRLPGPGYEAVNPDVRGLDPEEYPDVHKYKILADIAPKSKFTFQLKQQLFERRAAGITTEHENKIIDQASEIHSKMLSGFSDFDFHENAIKLPGISDVTSGAYKNAEEALRRVAAPAEYLIPAGFRPTQKLIGGTRDIVQEYEFNRMYGGANAFWDAPWRDWLRPSLVSAGRFMGIENPAVAERERVERMFDNLQLVKYSELAANADNPKDRKRYLQLAHRTSRGVNPQGNAYSIYMALPDEEKKYFEEFAAANESQRERIKSILPEERAELYENIWRRIGTQEESSLYFNGKDEILDEQRISSEAQLAKRELSESGELPPVDWVGWHNEVDLEDIKIKYIDTLGQDIHDHNLWENQLRRTYRRPYLDNSEMFLIRGATSNRNDLRRIMHGNLDIDMSDIQVHTQNTPYGRSYGNFSVEHDRTASILSEIRARLEE